MHRRILALMLLLAGPLAASAAVTPELQRQVRSATFEVVLKKPAEGAVRYEKPLPLELLPYVERTDAYRSIGTAFALGNNTFVTAAHVLVAAVGSQYGSPELRASDGTVHPIGNILKFSGAEDFIVFSLGEDFSHAALAVDRTPHVDDPVLAVGNALGEGIVIRDGLFTSETPEAQDGRWKWIRFSAAASPGNSGGPLLDASGSVAGVVIAKSPNENLNYALPIANVLDAPSKGRLDQRILTKLPYAQGSRTYVLRDEFALPLSWEKFVRTYQSLLERHGDRAREALLSAYASSLFPRGSGSDAILYGDDTSRREPAVVIQREDGTWVSKVPDFDFTELAGDGKVGAAAIAGAVLLVLHRGGEPADDGFYADSKSFMDVALKTLNLRRAVGTDQVRVVSLGSAVTDTNTSDGYGRRWQLRVWPVPFLDAYLTAMLLPTPDGYVGVLAYSPSVALRETKVQLAMLADQVTLTYEGTLAQWQAFLGRKPLLPESLKDVRLESGSGWTLRTRRFEIGVPPDLVKLDARSRLLMTTSYMVDGSRVVWDTNSVWWYPDAREKSYVGIWRSPRPPSTAPVEMRTRFEDLLMRRSPYDGAAQRVASDALEASMGLQAPGTKAGTASSDLVYGLTLRLDGRPSSAQIAEHQSQLLQSTHILEQGVGPDMAASPPSTAYTVLAAQMKAGMEKLQDWRQGCDQYGKDLRGRLCSDDIDQYVMPVYQAALKSPVGAASQIDTLKNLAERVRVLGAYWAKWPAAVHNRDLWRPFLIHNHLPQDQSHEAAVLAAEASLTEALSHGGQPTAEWTARSEALANAYVEERAKLTRKVAEDRLLAVTFRKRSSACPDPTALTSGRPQPRVRPGSRSLTEFYPQELRRQGVEGQVVVVIKVDHSGCATEAGVAGSSGSDEFDAAALNWVDTAVFLPAERDGKAVDAIFPLAVTFKLD